MTTFRSSKEVNLRISEEEQEYFLTPLSSDIKGNSFLNDNVREENDDSLMTDIDIEKDQDEDLDNIISSIGMGIFQKRLLVLVGFGWFSDALWLVCVAIILPRVQVHFQVSNSVIGLLPSSQFFGMMFGAVFWGIISDTYGRKQAFSWTLGFTVLFGFIASLSQSFVQLCFLFFMLGFGVGGNLPVDGAIFLEFVPKENQYLLTLSSVFFECGAAFTSLVGYLILPTHSCFEEIAACDVSKENNGWRYVILILGTCTLIMLVIRILFFRLLESPKFLLSHNRKQEAIFVFQEIARINGIEIEIQLDHLDDSNHSSQISSEHSLITSDSNKIGNIISTHFKQKFTSKFIDLKYLFDKQWISTTIIVWSMWGVISFGSVMFNLYLPKYLETLGKEENKLEDKHINGSEAIREGLKDFIIYTIWGVPGAIIASYLVESFLGRKGTMILGATGVSLSIFLFTNIHNHHYSIILFSMIIGCLKSINWAVIYCYTPEVFETKIRGTACGISSVFARITGMVSPIITGALISLGVPAPLYVTSFVYCILAILTFMLPIETRGRQA
ncbi:major facilitator superfamily domain-containing protein [Glomus cerebriforme]|uniref:Major facilitator superfamily domain-containing protein n=1 Tax=Glomus cerebriforme TaxID=658196 RepID=A0A397SP00_9GLOM|nr:major facilitator superfamily domain-containing protein [Glomus cerebriforme]